ncbi:MAG: NAD(P)H-hydrate dehydratase, partial [Tissierellia bacterium]|nr:NAD(P)H-hydrate dehydratase [Tissierellia bacterium]
INSHKGDYGRLGIVAGSYGMSGCAYLCAMAALRMGAGLVYNVVPPEIVDILSVKSLEAIVKTFPTVENTLNFLKEMDGIAVGPGMGTGEKERTLTREILSLDRKILVDADGLTNLKGQQEILKGRSPYQTVLTPHYGEFCRIASVTMDELKKDPQGLGEAFAREYQVVLLLKGHRTIVTTGSETYINTTGNPGMATAGSGDVLTGMVGALLCRTDPFTAAKMGACIHGLAGDVAKERWGEESLLARDLIDSISQVIKHL